MALAHAPGAYTRSAAAALIQGGVRLNGKRITAASQPVRIGDVLTLALDRSIKVVQVEGFREKRGDAATGRAIYRDLTTSSGAKAKACTLAGIGRKVSAPVRPTD